ncbi:MAG: methyltransferase [Candidatus Poribacteria bacterium]|nr:methyltransferase [Candidatus Poribacteria bacterium]MDE0503616.1 methyltransferase [Candidatus Poribacteria bacterium]
MSNVSPSPNTIEGYDNAILPALALLAGRQLDLFTPLKDSPLSAESIAEVLGVDTSKLELLLYALVAAGVLTVDDGRFSNTREANRFLVRGEPDYIDGGRDIDLWAHLLETVLKTADSVRTGFPQAFHDYKNMPAEDLERFFRKLHPGALAAGRDLASRCDFSSCRRMLDVGGGSGGVAIAAAEVYHHIRATIVDLPTVTPFTQQFVNESSARDRLRVLTADVVNEALTGRYDLAVLKAFTQTLSPAEIRKALKNVSSVVEPGGTVCFLAHILDDSRSAPRETAVFNLVFLNIYEIGQAYTVGEYYEWLEEAGFSEVQRTLLEGGPSLLVARKPD